jgi:excisionase family DNA binding protein
MDQYLTIDEVAALLKVKKSWLYNRTRPSSSDPIPCHRIGKYLRFKLPEVEEYLRSSEAASVTSYM